MAMGSKVDLSYHAMAPGLDSNELVAASRWAKVPASSSNSQKPGGRGNGFKVSHEVNQGIKGQ